MGTTQPPSPSSHILLDFSKNIYEFYWTGFSLKLDLTLGGWGSCFINFASYILFHFDGHSSVYEQHAHSQN